MAESPPSDLTEHSIEWVRDVIARWISQNETAQQLQRMMPHYVYEHVRTLSPGHDALPMAMALSMHPDSVIEARAWLESALAQVSALASLSHPTRIMETGPSEGVGATVASDDGGLEARIARVEARMVRVERLAEEVSSLAAELRQLHEARRAS